MQPLTRLKANPKGRDYTVGDIHGEFDKVHALLNKINFNPDNDRLFCVGDLIDRGPASYEVIAFLDSPYVWAVRGNHEQMAIEYFTATQENPVRALQMRPMFDANGGEWFTKLDYDRQARYSARFEELPYAIEIDGEEQEMKFGIVHAEVPGDDWGFFTMWMDQAAPPPNDGWHHVEHYALWGRDIIRGRADFKFVAGIDRVFVGHTPVRDYAQIGNVFYIDTGAVFGRKLTMIDINSLEVFTDA